MKKKLRIVTLILFIISLIVFLDLTYNYYNATTIKQHDGIMISGIFGRVFYGDSGWTLEKFYNGSILSFRVMIVMGIVSLVTFYIKEKCHGWNILLFFSIFLISLFSLEIFEMYSEADQIANQSIDGLSDISIQFVIDTYDAVDFSFLEEEDTEFVLMQHLSEDMPVYRVVYSNHFFYVDAGRDFTRSDFKNKQNVFICGSKAEEIFEVAPFIHNEEVFEKIGVLSDRNNTAEEYGIFTTEGNINEYPCYGELILEGIDRTGIEEVFLNIKSNMERNGYSIIRLDKKESKISDLYDLDGIGLKILLLTMFFLGGSMLFIVYFWTGQYDEVEKVYFLLGLKKLERRICMNFFLIFIIGIGMAMLVNPIPLGNMGVYTFMILCINMLLILGICLVLKRKGEWNEKNIRGNYI